MLEAFAVGFLVRRFWRALVALVVVAVMALAVLLVASSTGPVERWTDRLEADFTDR